MAWERKKNRYTPMEVARRLKVSTGKFMEEVAQGNMPKGRLGDDGRRYYTEKDLEFILREWHSKTTARFLTLTLPLILIITILAFATYKEISSQIDEMKTEAKATPKSGFAQPPFQLWAPGTPWPTQPEKPTPLYKRFNTYRKMRRKRPHRNYDDIPVTAE